MATVKNMETHEADEFLYERDLLLTGMTPEVLFEGHITAHIL